MSNQSNTLNITIDPSGAQAGANASIRAINSIINSGNTLNLTINQINNNLDQSTNRADKFFNRFGLGLKALAGSYVFNQLVGGLQSFIHEISRVDRVYNGFIAMMNVTTKDMEKSRSEYKYVAETARGYGVSLESLIKSYAKLRAATESVMTEKQTKRLFESFTAVSSVLHAEQVTVERMFNAIIQMASKGQVHMEELKQQLGEHLPGTLAIAAQALNMSMADMIKAMSKGQISAKQLLIPLPQILMDRFGESAKLTASSLHATFMTLKTSMFDAFKEMSTNGVALGLSKVLQAIQLHVDANSKSFAVFGQIVGVALLDLANFISKLSPEAIAAFTTKMLEMIKAAFEFGRSIFDIASWMILYREEISLTVQAYIAYAVYSKVAAASTLLIVGASNAATGAILLLRLALLSLLVFAAGWQFGTYIKDNFLVAEQAGIALAAGLTKIPVRIAGAFKKLSISIPLYLQEAFQNGLNKIFEFVSDVKNFGSGVAGMLGFDAPVFQPTMKFDFTSSLKKELGSAEAETAASLARIDDTYSDLFNQSAARHAAKDERTVAERLGIDSQSIKETEDLIARFNTLKEDSENIEKKGDTDKAGYGKGEQTMFGKASGRIDDLLNTYQTAVEKFKLLRDEGGISTSKMISSQIDALNKYTDAAVAILKSAKKLARSDNEHAQFDSAIDKLLGERQRNVIKYQREELDDREKFLTELEKIELDSGSRRLSNLEKFIGEWHKNNAKVMREALLNGDESSINRLLKAFESGVISSEMADAESSALGFARQLQAVVSLMGKTGEKNTNADKLSRTVGLAPNLFDGTAESVKNELRVYEEVFAKIEAMQQARLVSETTANQMRIQSAMVLQQKIIELEVKAANMRLQMGAGSWADGALASLGRLTAGFTTFASGATEVMGSFLTSVVDGFSNSIGRAIVYSEDLGTAIGDVARGALASLISGLVKVGLQYLLNAAIGKSIGAAATAANVALAGATATAWAPAAAMVSLATLGTNAAPAMAGILGTATLTEGLAMAGVGFEDGGYTGNGGVSEVAGVVHGKEFVMNAEATARHRPMLEALNNGSTISTKSGGAVVQDGATVFTVNIENYGVSKEFEVQQITPQEVRIIARDEASSVVRRDTPNIVASELSKPNSSVSKSIGRHIQAPRRR